MCFCALDAVTPLEKMNSVSQSKSNQLGRQNAGVQTQWHNLSISGPVHQSHLPTTTIHHAALLSHGGILTRDREAYQCTIRPYVTHMFLQSQVMIFMSFRIISKQHWCRTKAYKLPKTLTLFFCCLVSDVISFWKCKSLLNMMMPPALCVYYLTLSESILVNHSNIPSKTLVRHLLHNTYKHHIIFACIRGVLKLWAKHCCSLNI